MSNLSDYDPKIQIINELKAENNILNDRIKHFIEQEQNFDELKKSN